MTELKALLKVGRTIKFKELTFVNTDFVSSAFHGWFVSKHFFLVPQKNVKWLEHEMGAARLS